MRGFWSLQEPQTKQVWGNSIHFFKGLYLSEKDGYTGVHNSSDETTVHGLNPQELLIKTKTRDCSTCRDINAATFTVLPIRENFP